MTKGAAEVDALGGTSYSGEKEAKAGSLARGTGGMRPTGRVAALVEPE
jgi:hypothetical protein